MNGAGTSPLERAVALTLRMTEAAGNHDWNLVAQLEPVRQVCLDEVRAQPLKSTQRPLLIALDGHNRRLIELAGQAYRRAEEQLGRHQYNHRALASYIDSSARC